MSQCAAIKADNGRCGAQAITASQWCFSHHPDYEETRRRRAAKGGKRGGRGRPGADFADLKRDVRKVIDDVLAGNVLQGPGAVALQGYNTLLRATKVELEIREQTELIERMEELESLLERQNRGKQWGA
jgi:hypothetical protein